ncbi:MAG: PhzF family phenazine biosynthesis protein [Cyanobacteriota bacterium]
MKAVLIEAFTQQPLQGNGATVVLLEQPMPDAWLQGVAGSLKQSETAFLLPAPSGREWLLRWFTPSCEVPLCGHATLASLLALGHWGLLAPGDGTTFHTRSGPLPTRLDPEGGGGWIELPAGTMEAAPLPQSLAQLLQRSLGCGAEAFWTSALGYHVALLPAQAPLAAREPPGPQLPPPLRSGLVLMQPLEGPEGPDYQLRFFAPGLGIDEDPVTGSAHALVAPWWQEQLGRPRVVGWQCSDRPGGMVCEAASSGKIRLTGNGHLLWNGTLHAPARSSRSDGMTCSSEVAAWSALAPR